MTAPARTLAAERVILRASAGRPGFARLREPCGEDELSVEGVDTRSAVTLLDRLLVAPERADALAASDRDALLAALYRQLWGDRLVSSLCCTACEAMYDLSFELSELQRQLAQQAPPHEVTASRSLRTADGACWTLPNADEEEQAAALGLHAGRAQLAEASAASGTAAAEDAAAALEALAPLIDVDLDTTCAECGHSQQARFDLQSFVLQRLLDEREGLLAELHRLASSYGWSLREILSLPRSLRRSLAERAGGALG
jgi:hypothetical protein